MACLSTQFSTLFSLQTLDYICLSLSFCIFIMFLSLSLSCRFYCVAPTGRDAWNVWFIAERSVYIHCKHYLNCSAKCICFVKDVPVIWSDPHPPSPSTCIFCLISLQGIRFNLFNDVDTQPPRLFLVKVIVVHIHVMKTLAGVEI